MRSSAWGSRGRTTVNHGSDPVFKRGIWGLETATGGRPCPWPSMSLPKASHHAIGGGRHGPFPIAIGITFDRCSGEV